MSFRKWRPPQDGLEVNLLDAEGALNLATHLAGGISTSFLRLAARTRIAASHYSLGDVEGARAFILGCIDDADRLKDTQIRAEALFRISEALGEMDDPEGALQHLEKGVSCAGYIEVAAKSSRAYRRIAEAIARQGENASDLQRINEALSITEKILETPYKVASLCSISKSLAAVGEIEHAINTMQKSKEAAAHADETFRPVVYHTLAQGYDDIGDEQTAFQVMKYAYDLSLTILNPVYKSMVLAKIAHTLSLMGAENEARDTISQALSTGYSVQDNPGRVSALSSLALSLGQMEMYKDAQNMLQHVIVLLGNIMRAAERDTAIMNIIESLCGVVSYPSWVARETGRWERAISLLEVKSEIGEASACISRANEELQNGNYTEAVKTMRVGRRVIITSVYRRRKMVQEMTLRLESMDTNLLMFREAGMDTSTFEELISQARSAMEARQYEEAGGILDKLSELSESMHLLMVPDLKVRMDPCRFVAGSWSRVTLRAKNEGKGRARRAKFSFDGPVDVQGETVIEDIPSGEERSLVCPLLPKEGGNILLKVGVSVEGAGGSVTSRVEEMWIDVEPATAKSSSPEARPGMPAAPSAPPQSAAAVGDQHMAEKAWRHAAASLHRGSLEFEEVPVPGEVMFDTILDVLLDMGYTSLPPKKKCAHGFFRGAAKFSMLEGPDKASLEVISSSGKSKVILRLYMEDPKSDAVETIMHEIGLRFDLEPYMKKRGGKGEPG